MLNRGDETDGRWRYGNEGVRVEGSSGRKVGVGENRLVYGKDACELEINQRKLTNQLASWAFVRLAPANQGRLVRIMVNFLFQYRNRTAPSVDLSYAVWSGQVLILADVIYLLKKRDVSSERSLLC